MEATPHQINKTKIQHSKAENNRCGAFPSVGLFAILRHFLSCHCGIPVPVLFLCALDAYLFTVLPYMPCVNGVMRQVGCNRFLFSAFGKERTISL